MNLCVNARDAMPDGGTLTIAVRDVDVDEALAVRHPPLALGPHVELFVGDTGIGMDPAVRERIFEPSSPPKPRAEASGLGLAVVYRIVQHSGGSLWVDTAPGKGTSLQALLAAGGEGTGRRAGIRRRLGPGQRRNHPRRRRRSGGWRSGAGHPGIGRLYGADGDQRRGCPGGARTT